MGSTSFLGFPALRPCLMVRPCLMGPKSRILEICKWAIFGFQGKIHLMGWKSTHFQESDFQQSDEVDRFLKMGTHFQEDRSLLKTVFVLHGQAFVYAQRICGF